MLFVSILAASIALYANLNHQPQIVYPPEFSAAVRTQWPNTHPINQKLVD